MAQESASERPDPDALLAQVQAEEARKTEGRLKVFFGMAAGVGKTYAMLTAARAEAEEGVDVVVGYVEPHARPETMALTLGLDLIPYKEMEYRGTTLKELDLDAALKRRPELLLVDELAHTNATGSRHAKRWQDIQELLAAGINVYTTLNVQHMESLNDVVAQITGITVRETVPDAIFERADEIELVDLTPDELLDRLADGKVYVPEQAQYAVQSFFKKPNLTALRELALRKTAEGVNRQVQTARREEFARKTWPTAERVLVCVSPSTTSAKVIRSAKRLAVSLHADWTAVYVETPRLKNLRPIARDHLLRNFRLAERLGAETVTLSGLRAVEEIVNYARSRNVTKIVAGKPDRPWWQDFLFRSNADQLLRESGEIDVYVVRGIEPSPGDELEGEPFPQQAPPENLRWKPYQFAVGVVAVSSVIGGFVRWMWPGFDLANFIMLYLAGVVFVAARYGRWPSTFASVLSVLVFDFFFVPPYLTFAVADTQYFITFGVMLGIALLISSLTAQVREQADASRKRERRTEALYRMTRELAGMSGATAIAEAAVRHASEVFQAKVALLMPDESGKLHVRAATDTQAGRASSEWSVAQWVSEHRQVAGHCTDTLPSAELLYLPLVASDRVVGVIGLRTPQTAHLLSPQQRQLLDAFLNQISLALERDRWANEARQAQVRAESEKLRSALLSSVSHDLRTPLAVITGATSTLLAGKPGPDSQREILQTIHDEAERLTRLVANLLDITRLESGAVQLNREWYPLEEIVGTAIRRLERQFEKRPLSIRISQHLPLVHVDGILLEQVFINLLENAVKYTPEETSIEISAVHGEGNFVLVEVADNGLGLPSGTERLIFDKFYRTEEGKSQRGVGLGLPICRAIVEAHGGKIWAENRPGPAAHGARFRFTIPMADKPPSVPAFEKPTEGMAP